MRVHIYGDSVRAINVMHVKRNGWWGIWCSGDCLNGIFLATSTRRSRAFSLSPRNQARTSLISRPMKMYRILMICQRTTTSSCISVSASSLSHFDFGSGLARRGKGKWGDVKTHRKPLSAHSFGMRANISIVMVNMNYRS